MEVCVENIESAINAENGGASRIELCSALSEGGLTPTLGVFKVIKKLCNIPIFVMLRPRPGDFTYDSNEVDAIKLDAQMFLNAGADGFVFGALTPEGDIDEQVCKEVLDIVKPKPTTFHRAFDWVQQPFDALMKIESLGFDRILTSGQQETAEKGIPLISELNLFTRDTNIIIVPGAGITVDNIRDIVQTTFVQEFHASARVSKEKDVYRNKLCSMGTQDVEYKVTSTELVEEMVECLQMNKNNF